MIVSMERAILLIACFIVTTKSLVLPQNKNACEPNKIYKEDNITCSCSSNSTWPNEECKKYFNSDRNLVCNPNTYIFVGCNVCLCGRDGRINKNRCTKHDCGPIPRRSNAVVETCHPNSFYSLAPCQFCYCVNKHKLVCNTKPITEKVVLGKYELNQCIGNVIKELASLIPGTPLRSHTTHKNGKSRSGKHGKATTVLEIGTNIRSIEEWKEKTDDNDVHNDEENVNKKHHRNKSLKKEILERSKTTEAVDSDVWNGYSKEKNKKTKQLKIFKSYEPEPHSEMIDRQNQQTKSSSTQIDLPYVLDKVLNLVLRKSMLSLESGDNCTPGSAKKVDCNKCFCLSNGKMLCTKNKCK